MIWICTLNPSIDYHMSVDSLDLGKTNRSQCEHVVIGGKGINVAIVLNELDVASTVFGFVGGFTGDKIVNELQKYPHIHDALTRVEYDTRINVKVKGQVETEINGRGQPVSETDVKTIETTLSHVSKGDLVVLTGSVANGMDYRWYLNVARQCLDRGIEFVVDFADTTLLEVLKYKPRLIKPNVSELEAILNTPIETDEDIIKGAQKLVSLGAQACIISNGAKGSFLVTHDAIFTSNIPEGDFKNSVGSGDSMVAGYLKGYIAQESISTSYQYAVACASATAYSEHLATHEAIDQLMKRVKISEVGGTL
ncbi:hypothetical protein AOC36_01885 [Erysipelothrix larvae]|uniref:Tagatose-6-phosphate kinase n=1 Tax=Erysipelothrix larvae TaxID=1514105 RepID=A0A109UGK3_9FIRM|nr:1-phosphofructokinase [Erysipelothrix larvae]AMC92777.1 hypothetical protein AOC36_01885 [Erysipelothrix larvae]